MQAADLPAVLAVQAAAYPPALHEDGATFAGRLAAAPDCAWVAAGPLGIAAYLVGYRSSLGKVTPLGGSFSPLVAGASSCLYLHDLAVSPTAGGQGLGLGLARTAWQAACANGLTHSALVALADAAGFWERLGYQTASSLDSRQQRHLQSYPPPATYMVKMLLA